MGAQRVLSMLIVIVPLIVVPICDVYNQILTERHGTQFIDAVYLIIKVVAW